MASTDYAETEPRNVAVNCRHCSNRISFVRPQRLCPEIGLKCSKCGRRMIYAAADLHAFADPIKAQPADVSVGLLARLFR
jgi:DNA-directed RNA polymerase subunit RPC12/RpoP